MCSDAYLAPRFRRTRMRLDKLTVKTREALVAAQELAHKKGQPELAPEHILASLLAQREGLVPALLQKAGADPAPLAAALAREVDRLPRQEGSLEVGLSRKTKQLIEAAEREADKFKDEYTSTEHLLLAFLH